MTALKYPTSGARIVFDRVGAGPDYALAVYEPNDVLRTGQARFAPGAFSITDWDAEPPAWVLVYIERMLASLHRKHAAASDWPRRLSRWRQKNN